jgi:hypothetical protein
MRKIATTNDLQHELLQLLDHAGGHQPSRVALSRSLLELSRRVAATSIWEPVLKAKDVANLGSLSLVAHDDAWVVYGVEAKGGTTVKALKDGEAKSRDDAKAQAEAAAKTILKASLARL